MFVRTCTDADLDTVVALIADDTGAVVNTAKPERFADSLSSGAYRPEWIWVAEDEDRLVAAAVFWGFNHGELPLALDGLFAVASVPDPDAVWTSLIRSAIASRPAEAEPIEYHVFLPGDWHSDETIAAALTPRLDAAAGAGLTEHLERFRYEWLPSMGVPARSTRLSFRPEPDDSAWVEVFAAVAAGSLDAATQDGVRRLGVTASAQSDLDLYKSMPGDRSWWKLAYDETGTLVGFAMPSANYGGPVVGFLGVVPEHRGHGYVDDLLAEITADLAETGAQRITADTDSTNLPMAAAFDRAGYHRFGMRLVASAAS